LEIYLVILLCDRAVHLLNPW